MNVQIIYIIKFVKISNSDVIILGHALRIYIPEEKKNNRK